MFDSLRNAPDVFLPALAEFGDELTGIARWGSSWVALISDSDPDHWNVGVDLDDRGTEVTARFELFGELLEAVAEHLDDPQQVAVTRPSDVVVLMVLERGIEIVVRTATGYECARETTDEPGQLQEVSEHPSVLDALQDSINESLYG